MDEEIYENLNPTVEIISKMFINKTLSDLLSLNYFNIIFNNDGLNHIKETNIEVYNELTNKKIDSKKPSLIIKNHELFFKLLTIYYANIMNKSTRHNLSKDPFIFDIYSIMENIWFRMKPEDFNNVEEFLLNNISMIEDKTFSKYSDETIIGETHSIVEGILTVEDSISRIWDETPKEFVIKLYDKKYYSKYDIKPCYQFPIIRYGIYERNNKKVCYIASIQNPENDPCSIINIRNIKKCEIINEFNTKKNIINKGSQIRKVSPSHLLSLNIFINFLKNEDIKHIEAAGLYPLDYDFHDGYFLDKEKYKTDLVSKNKSEIFLYNFLRLKEHYKDIEITSYPGDNTNTMHLVLPDTLTSNSEALNEFNELVNNSYKIKTKKLY